jgi:hypothetical protein
MADEPHIIFAGSEGQNVEYEHTVNGKPEDLTGASATFYMRYADSSELKVDGETATIPEPETGQLFYGWSDPDLDEPGEYYAWFNIDPADDEPFDTEEFLLIITHHAPGVRTTLGTIAKLTQSILPITWTALANADEYGDGLLQKRIEIVKLKALNSTVLPADEEDLDLRVQSFLSKLAALAIIPAGIDFWMNKKNTFSAAGSSSETATYPDRVDALWKLYEKLTAEVAAEQDEVEVILGGDAAVGTPGVTDGALTGERNFKTPHHSDFHPYGFPSETASMWPWIK